MIKSKQQCLNYGHFRDKYSDDLSGMEQFKRDFVDERKGRRRLTVLCELLGVSDYEAKAVLKSRDEAGTWPGILAWYEVNKINSVTNQGQNKLVSKAYKRTADQYLEDVGRRDIAKRVRVTGKITGNQGVTWMNIVSANVYKDDKYVWGMQQIENENWQWVMGVRRSRKEPLVDGIYKGASYILFPMDVLMEAVEENLQWGRVDPFKVKVRNSAYRPFYTLSGPGDLIVQTDISAVLCGEDIGRRERDYVPRPNPSFVAKQIEIEKVRKGDTR